MPPSAAPHNWFEDNGEAYARFRPDYPERLASFLADRAPSLRRAVDVGCGSGQLTALLAPLFDEVTGVDPSADQIAHAAAVPGVRWVCASAEALPLPDRCASLITVAQAAHWFDLPAFYAEVRRIAVDGAVLALVSYGPPRLQGALQDRFRSFYDHEIGPWWPPERRHVDSGYRDLGFPFPEQEAPELEIRRLWVLDEFLGYLSTWSAVRNARNAGCGTILARFSADLSALWGDPETRRPVCWPLTVRLGVVNSGP
ncbi:methyltransferase domain-containing protein [Phaeovibrio sulfidiphilus]|uniref:Methyltransferase domain-containing protein n=1 Tax=Phaeovibrio sulfidiphilus TaxID=1220600 RepID=A0A8J6YLF4_9PROT|nr:class I SAM-dependent methyltransferase [Phaeovibrio sulfidiphilus]MBE1236560.1 methyltransferase domain-containing protein [Phaeovibrio sulfidiphilus]